MTTHHLIHLIFIQDPQHQHSTLSVVKPPSYEDIFGVGTYSPNLEPSSVFPSGEDLNPTINASPAMVSMVPTSSNSVFPSNAEIFVHSPPGAAVSSSHNLPVASIEQPIIAVTLPAGTEDLESNEDVSNAGAENQESLPDENVVSSATVLESMDGGNVESSFTAPESLGSENISSDPHVVD